MYNQNQVQALARELRDRFIKNLVNDYEIVITLVTMEQVKLVTPEHIAEILLYVFFSSKQGVLRALERAKPLLSDSLVDAVIAEVKQDKN